MRGRVLLGLLGGVVACDDTDPMASQPRAEAFKASTFFEDGRAMRPLVPGTVAQEWLAFRGEGAKPCLRQDAAQAESPGPDAFHKSPLRHEVDAHLSGKHLPLRLGIGADMARDDSPNELGIDELADAYAWPCSVVGDHRQVPSSQLDERVDKTRRRSCPHEPADQQGGTVRDQVRGVRRLNGFHDWQMDRCFSPSSPQHSTRSGLRGPIPGADDAASAHICAPIIQGTVSSFPRPSSSLLDISPDAILSMSSKISRPFDSSVAPPSITSPQLMSMSSFIRRNIFVLVANLIEGAGFAPKQEPRPVVKATRLAPLAICPVAPIGS